MRKLNIRMTLPTIIISTIAGTANFAQETFPVGIQPYVPLVTGSLNLFVGIMNTVQQFLKVSELMESHRAASLHYGKLSRTIRLELSLPVADRTYNGRDMLEMCRAEYDRLIEQSPPIRSDILRAFEKEFPQKNEDLEAHLNFHRPEILNINPIKPYNSAPENKIISEVAERLRRGSHSLSIKDKIEERKPYPSGIFSRQSSRTPTPIKTPPPETPAPPPQPTEAETPGGPPPSPEPVAVNEDEETLRSVEIQQ